MLNEQELYNEIGKKIKERRKSLGITQEKLAEQTNYSSSFIANIESKTYQSFSISALNNIAKALNTSMLNLLPDEKTFLSKTEEIKCGYCDYQTEIPIEISRLLHSVKEITNQKLKLTCPKCNKKIM